MAALKSFFSVFKELFEKHGVKAARSGKEVSIATRTLRRVYLTREFNRLITGKLVMRRKDGAIVRQVAYKLESPYSLKRKHVESLVADWVARDLSAAYIHNMLSMLRVFAEWIGKRGLIPSAEEIIPDAAKKRRRLVALFDKSWTGCGLSPMEKIAEIETTDIRVASALRLMWVFSERLKESSLMKPWLADRGNYLDVCRGTKNRRGRTHDIRLASQRAAIEIAKVVVGPNPEACLIPKRMTYRQWQNHVYYILEDHGVTIKKCGTSTHGLRREGLNDLYEAVTGHPSPVRGGTLGVTDPVKDRLGRREVAEVAGHSRIYKSSAYVGPYQRKPAENVTKDDAQKQGPNDPASNSDSNMPDSDVQVSAKEPHADDGSE